MAFLNIYGKSYLPEHISFERIDYFNVYMRFCFVKVERESVWTFGTTEISDHCPEERWPELAGKGQINVDVEDVNVYHNIKYMLLYHQAPPYHKTLSVLKRIHNLDIWIWELERWECSWPKRGMATDSEEFSYAFFILYHSLLWYF
jgi:hypothetical protein